MPYLTSFYLIRLFFIINNTKHLVSLATLSTSIATSVQPCIDKYSGSKVTQIDHKSVKKKYRNCPLRIEINHGNSTLSFFTKRWPFMPISYPSISLGVKIMQQICQPVVKQLEFPWLIQTCCYNFNKKKLRQIGQPVLEFPWLIQTCCYNFNKKNSVRSPLCLSFNICYAIQTHWKCNLM